MKEYDYIPKGMDGCRKAVKPLLLIVLVASVMTGCQNKKEICANWSTLDVYRRNTPEVAQKYYRKLGIKEPVSEDKHINYRWRDSVSSYCQFYMK